MAAVRVIIVDDSALMRELLTEILSRDPEIEVVDTAADPLIAREKIKKHNPDVITLDVEMPRMSGIEFLSRIMALRPMPVIMFSSLTQQGTDTTLKALELGAVDAIGKPSGFVAAGMNDLAEELISKVKGAALSKVRNKPVEIKKAVIAPSQYRDMVIALGASTGGVPVLNAIIDALPTNAPPVLITQHMPPGFTARFAARTNESATVTVHEARHGQKVEAGNVYIAPGGYQMRLKKSQGERRLEIIADEKVNGFAPSVDVLFKSIAEADGPNAVGAILTGMGFDGARGLLAMKQVGAHTFCQDEATSVVFGMPKAALDLGAVDEQVPQNQLADTILSRTRSTLSRSA
jgi:two-component system chemotaxis response regulator CheB